MGRLPALTWITLFWINQGVAGKLVGPRPIRTIHGLGAACSQYLADDYCIESGPNGYSYTDFKLQAATVCSKLKAEMLDEQGTVRESFKYGFHFIGDSQGGIIARLVLRNCPEIRPLARTLSTVGTPNLGLSTIEHLPRSWFEGDQSIPKKIEELMARKVTGEYPVSEDRTFTLESIVVGAEKSSAVMEEIESEPENDFSSLDAFIAIGFTEDAIIPFGSAVFGLTLSELPDRQISDFEKSPYHSRMGMGKLFENQGLYFCWAEGPHMAPEIPWWSELKTLLADFDGKTVEVPEGSTPEEFYQVKFRERLANHDYKNFKCGGHHVSTDPGKLLV